MQNYNEVPLIITGKDLDYLCDIFNWNFNACKLINDFMNKVNDEEIISLLKTTYDVHKNNLDKFLNILR